MNNALEQFEESTVSEIKVPFDPGRTPRSQIESALATVQPLPCERHPHEMRHLNREATLQSTAAGFKMAFTQTYDRCDNCQHTHYGSSIEVDGCAAQGRHWIAKDSSGILVPTRYAEVTVDLDLSPSEQFDVWSAKKGDLHCRHAVEPLQRQMARIIPSRASWTIMPQFKPCLQCALERLGIAPDEARASFDNFRADRSELQVHLDACRAFAASPKGVLVLLGNCGTGKTHLAIAVMRELLRQGVREMVFAKHRHFLAEHHRSMRPVSFGDEAPQSPLKRSQEAALLVYDELTPATDNRPYEDVLLDLFETRNGHFRPSVITTNLNRQELQAALGSRLFDRLRRAAFAVLEFGFESKRSALNADYLARTDASGRS